ncbi:Protein arginine N-methyltransferase [Mycena venus]|uniref:Protein arginine N-methyltransferase n=1 Tax=Mycena venus TaxID=2733690 RepID=A0A8H7DGR1_9AGAR|nr:Protein arginine N-methyltransferase [Mycena venus]
MSSATSEFCSETPDMAIGSPTYHSTISSRKPTEMVSPPHKRPSLFYSDTWRTAEDFDPAVLWESPPPAPSARQTVTERRRYVASGLATKFLGWPSVVIFGQLWLQCMTWGFFIAVKAHGQIPLPFEVALWVKDNGHLVILLTTLLATVLAGLSSFLFSYAIRRSMVLYLNRPVSLATLGASVSISMRSLVLHRRSWKWPTISLLFFVLAGFQTSSWSTLLTPVTIIVSTPLVGSEIDLSSPVLRDMFTSGDWSVPSYCLDNDAVWDFGQAESAYAAARALSGKPTTFTLMDQTFNVSTGGILPAYLNPFDVSAWFTDRSILPATTRSVDPHPIYGFSQNYSMVQQGYTADVSCSFRNLTNETTPAIFLPTYAVEGFDAEYFGMYSSCDMTLHNLKSTAAILITDGPAPGLLLAIICGTSNYTVIILTNGIYDWLPMTVCSIAPKITTVHADYTSTINTTVDPNGVVVSDSNGWPSLFAMTTLGSMAIGSQSLSHNVVGSHLSSIKAESKWNTDHMLEAVAEYIKGTVEYSGSVFRACFSVNTTFDDGVPSNITIPTYGMLHTETFGWDYASQSTCWVLVPGTLIALATIVVVGMALYRDVGNVTRATGQFDPSDPLRLIAAAAAGGLNNAFTGLGEKDIEEGEKLDVVLGSIPGRGPALLRADRYRSVFNEA